MIQNWGRALAGVLAAAVIVILTACAGNKMVAGIGHISGGGLTLPAQLATVDIPAGNPACDARASGWFPALLGGSVHDVFGSKTRGDYECTLSGRSASGAPLGASISLEPHSGVSAVAINREINRLGLTWANVAGVKVYTSPAGGVLAFSSKGDVSVGLGFDPDNPGKLIGNVAAAKNIVAWMVLNDRYGGQGHGSTGRVPYILAKVPISGAPASAADLSSIQSGLARLGCTLDVRHTSDLMQDPRVDQAFGCEFTNESNIVVYAFKTPELLANAWNSVTLEQAGATGWIAGPNWIAILDGIAPAAVRSALPAGTPLDRSQV